MSGVPVNVLKITLRAEVQAAYGLLRLVFINQISLSKFDVDQLMAFQ
jgi:hypothetical protein